MKNNKINFIVVLFVLFTMNNLKAQLYVKNSTSSTISFSMGWYDETDKCYTTKGWFNVEPGKTISTGLNFTKNNDEFYYYATSTTGKWEGTYLLLTNSVAFTISCADKKYVQDANPSYTIKKFRQKKVQFAANAEKTYTLNFTDSQQEQKEAEAKAAAVLDSTLVVSAYEAMNMQILADSTAAVNAMYEAEAAYKAQIIMDSLVTVAEKYSGDPFFGTFNYKNTTSFTGYVLNVSPPTNTYSDYNFELQVSSPDNSYTIEGFAVKKEETVEYYYTKTTKGNFPLAATVNKKKPLFSLKKVNDLVLTIWGQIQEDENIKVLFKQ